MLAAYNALIAETDLIEADFSGSKTADSLRVLRDFVNGIDRPQPVTER